MTVWIFLLTALAGGIGAGLRYVIDAIVAGGRSARFPFGILLVNITGSLALGVLTGAGAGLIGSETAWVAGVGLLGGYTTFSTVSVESVLLARAGSVRRGVINAAGTLVLGVVAAAVGLGSGAALTVGS